MLRFFSQLFIGHSPRYLKPEVAMGPAGTLAGCITCSQKSLNTQDLVPNMNYLLIKETQDIGGLNSKNELDRVKNFL